MRAMQASTSAHTALLSGSPRRNSQKGPGPLLPKRAETPSGQFPREDKASEASSAVHPKPPRAKSRLAVGRAYWVGVGLWASHWRRAAGPHRPSFVLVSNPFRSVSVASGMSGMTSTAPALTLGGSRSWSSASERPW